MSRSTFVPLAVVAVCLLISIDTSKVMAANMRSFIEAVRRKATVVYFGSVKEVQLLARTKFDIKARAVVDVLAVARRPGMTLREATIEYSSFDDKTPMWRAAHSINCGLASRWWSLQTPSQAPFLLDIFCRVAARSCCNVL
jgi:hypothetical protein